MARPRVARWASLAVSISVALTLAACSSSSGSGAGGGGSANPSATKATGTLGKLQAKGTATAGIVNQPPFSGVSPTGGTVGFSPELAKKILNDLGVANMKTTVGEYGDMIPGLEAGRWDFVAASLVVTPERCQQVIFSDPIVSDYVRLAYKSGSAPTSLKQLIASKQKVGILTGSTYIAQFEAAGMPKSQLVQFNDIRSGIDGVLAGRVPVMAGSATGFNIKGLDSRIKLSPRLTDIPPSISAFAFKKSDTAFRDAINADLKKLESNGDYDKILKKWGFTGKEIQGLTTAAGCKGSA